MEPDLLAILKEAVETRQRKEDLDRSIGRALRRHKMDFKTYVKITSELRELALSKGMSVDGVAKELLAEHEKHAD